MFLSRRNLLWGIGASTALGVTRSLPAFADASGNAFAGSNPSPAVIRLDRNENAYGPSDQVSAAMRAGIADANRFPDLESDGLIDCIAHFHSIPREKVILGCGSTEILRMCCRALLGPGKKLVLATPGFDPVAQFARETGAAVESVPLNSMHAHDLPAMSRRIERTGGVIYICNPHNPTGTLTPRKDIEVLVRGLPPDTYVVIDEAYHHYVMASSSYSSFIDTPVTDARIVVTRTFSKIFGLAGMRVGYGIADPETAQRISEYRLREGVNVSAARAARIALESNDHVRACAQSNADNRQEFSNQANARMLRWIDSHANFVLLNTARSGLEIVQHFRQNNVLLAGGFRGMENYVRVTIGTSAEMKEFWRVWDLLPAHGMVMQKKLTPR